MVHDLHDYATIFHETITDSSGIPSQSSSSSPPVVSPNLQDEGPGGHGTDLFLGHGDSFGRSNLS